MTRWETLARRVVIATAVVTGLLLLLAMGLSYTGLRAFYLGAGFPTLAASLFPLPVDLLFPVGFVALLVLPGGRKWYAAAVVAFSGIASAAAQGYHQSHGGVTATITDGRVLFVAGASAMVCALIAGHLLWLILERALPAGFISAMRADTQTTPEPVAKRAPVPAVPPELERTPADYDPRPRQVLTDLMQPLPAMPPAVVNDPPPVPVRLHSVHRPTPQRGAPSQRTGPCDPRCELHDADAKVSKSTRYRCVARINAREEASG